MAPNPGVIGFLRQFQPDDLLTAAICEAEIRYGLERLPRGRKRDNRSATEHLAGPTRPSGAPDGPRGSHRPAHHLGCVLAAAHLNHDPSYNRWRNLRSFCQRCRMLHDRSYHLAQRLITYRLRYAIGDLFVGLYQRKLAAPVFNSSCDAGFVAASGDLFCSPPQGSLAVLKDIGRDEADGAPHLFDQAFRTRGLNRSGRSSCGGIRVSLATAATCLSGTRVHRYIAAAVMPRCFARSAVRNSWRRRTAARSERVITLS